MCISATVSYSAAVVLIATGVYAIRQSRQLPQPYSMWALIPVFFGLQQASEGKVWQALNANNTEAAVQFALVFHFFSHFLWLWWLPLSSYLIEPEKTSRIRKKVFAGCAILGACAGALVYAAMLLHPEWLSVVVREHAIVYNFSAPYRSDIQIPITPVMLYGLIILVPLLFSSHRHLKIFGVLIVLSMILAEVIFHEAFVSVWCLFAALLSLYLVYMIRTRVAALNPAESG